MGMFGVLGPRFVYDHGGGSEATVDLDYAVMTTSEPDTRYFEHRSELDLDRSFVYVGTHWRVTFIIGLHKYASKLTKYQTITSYKGKLVSLWLHRDGSQFLTTGGDDALFILRDIRPFYLTDIREHDMLELQFESVDPIARKSYNTQILVFDAEPGFAGRSYTLPTKASTDDYFLLPLALDGSAVEITNQTATGFTVSPADDGGTVRILFIDPEVALAATGIKVGTFTTVTMGVDVAVTFTSPAFTTTNYFLLCLATNGEQVITSAQATTGFNVKSTLTDVVTGTYLAVELSATDVGETYIRAGQKDHCQPAGTAVTFSTAMPTAGYMALCLDVDGEVSVSPENPTTTGFVAKPVEMDTDVRYAVFGKGLLAP